MIVILLPGFAGNLLSLLRVAEIPGGTFEGAAVTSPPVPNPDEIRNNPSTGPKDARQIAEIAWKEFCRRAGLGEIPYGDKAAFEAALEALPDDPSDRPQTRLAWVKDDYAHVCQSEPGELDEEDTYDIEMDAIEDPMALIRWVNHLAPKTWVTVEHLRHFVQAVASARGWDLHPVRQAANPVG